MSYTPTVVSRLDPDRTLDQQDGIPAIKAPVRTQEVTAVRRRFREIIPLASAWGAILAVLGAIVFLTVATTATVAVVRHHTGTHGSSVGQTQKFQGPPKPGQIPGRLAPVAQARTTTPAQTTAPPRSTAAATRTPAQTAQASAGTTTATQATTPAPTPTTPAPTPTTPAPTPTTPAPTPTTPAPTPTTPGTTPATTTTGGTATP